MEPASHSITTALPLGGVENRELILRKGEDRWGDLLRFIARGILPENCRRCGNEEDAVQEAWFALNNELKLQEALRALAGQFARNEPGTIPDDTLKDILKWLARFLREVDNLAALTPRLPGSSRLKNLLQEVLISKAKPALQEVCSLLSAVIEADTEGIKILMEQVLASETFKTGEDIRKWLCRVVTNKAYNVLKQNRQHEGLSTLVRGRKGGESQDPAQALDERAGLADLHSSMPDLDAQLADLEHKTAVLSEAVIENLARMSDPEKTIIDMWTDWEVYRKLGETAEGMGLTPWQVKVLTFDFKTLPDLEEKARFREPLVERIRAFVANSPECRGDPERHTRRLLEIVVRCFLQGKGTRLLADLRDGVR